MSQCSHRQRWRTWSTKRRAVLVPVRVVLVPLLEGFGRSVGPVVDDCACASAGEGFATSVFGDTNCGPTLLAPDASDKPFVVAETSDAELAVPGELVALDGFGTPALLEFVQVFFTVLVQRDWFLGPLARQRLAVSDQRSSRSSAWRRRSMR